MPVNLTFAGKHGQDASLLKYAYAFELQTRHRTEPPVTPVLKSDRIVRTGQHNTSTSSVGPASLDIASSKRLNENTVQVQGTTVGDDPDSVQLEASVDGQLIPPDSITRSGKEWVLKAEFSPYHPLEPQYGGMALTVRTVNVMILARSGGDVIAGKLVMIA